MCKNGLLPQTVQRSQRYSTYDQHFYLRNLQNWFEDRIDWTEPGNSVWIKSRSLNQCHVLDGFGYWFCRGRICTTEPANPTSTVHRNNQRRQKIKLKSAGLKWKYIWNFFSQGTYCMGMLYLLWNFSNCRCTITATCSLHEFRNSFRFCLACKSRFGFRQSNGSPKPGYALQTVKQNADQIF